MWIAFALVILFEISMPSSCAKPPWRFGVLVNRVLLWSLVNVGSLRANLAARVLCGSRSGICARLARHRTTRFAVESMEVCAGPQMISPLAENGVCRNPSGWLEMKMVLFS